MPRRKWTTPEQEEWLKDRLATFIDAQVNKSTTSTFFPEVIRDWREKWPISEPTAEEIANATSPEVATKKKQNKDEEVGQ